MAVLNLLVEPVSTRQLNPHSWLRKLSQVGKLLLGIILLGLIISRISLSSLLTTLRTLDTRFLLEAYAFYLITVILLSYRWYILYGIYKQGRPTFLKLLSVSFMGIFFNNIMLSSVGGDVYRVLYMSRENSNLSGAFSTIFIDRLLGLLSLVLVGFLAIVFGTRYVTLPTELILWDGVIFASLCTIFILSNSTRFHTFLLSVSGILLPASKYDWIHKKFARLSGHLVLYARDKRLLINAFMVSITFHIVWILGCYITSLALHLNLPIYIFFIAMPVIELVRAIPITIQGIGVREGVFVLLFAQFGVPGHEAFVLAFLIYLLVTLNGVFGGGIYFLNSLLQPRAINVSPE